MTSAEAPGQPAPAAEQAVPVLRIRLHADWFVGPQHAGFLVYHRELTGTDWMHDHDFWEFVVIESGRGLSWTADGMEPLAPGDFVLVNPGSRHAHTHAYSLWTYGGMVTVELAETLRRLLRGTTVGGLMEAPNPGRIRVPLGELLGPASQVLDELCTADQSRFDRLSLLLKFFGFVDKAAEGLPPDLRNPDLHRGVRLAVDMMKSDLAHDWTLVELARRVAVERSHLIKLFRQDLGVTPMAYLARLRAEQAAMLMRQPDLSLAAIGTQVGWTDPAHFARRFRRLFGSSPRAFRARLAAPQPSPPRMS